MFTATGLAMTVKSSHPVKVNNDGIVQKKKIRSLLREEQHAACFENALCVFGLQNTQHT